MKISDVGTIFFSKRFSGYLSKPGCNFSRLMLALTLRLDKLFGGNARQDFLVIKLPPMELRNSDSNTKQAKRGSDSLRRGMAALT
jgi:hypothetical protein